MRKITLIAILVLVSFAGFSQTLVRKHQYELPALNEVLSPTASGTWSMGGNTLTYNFTNPNGGMLFNMTGGWGGHVFEIIDSSVSNSSVGDHLIHVQTARENVIAGHFLNSHVLGTALHVEGKSMFMGSVTANSFIKSGGTSSQYLMADGSVLNYTVQPLSGTTPTLNANAGINGFLTMTGNTVITLSNIAVGVTGNITVINNSAGNYTITFSGYTIDTQDHLESTNDVITLPPGRHRLSYWYDGTYAVINGSLNYD